MKYHIKNDNGDIVASFVNECDRDYSLDALDEAFDLVEEDEKLVKYDDK